MKPSFLNTNGGPPPASEAAAAAPDAQRELSDEWARQLAAMLSAQLASPDMLPASEAALPSVAGRAPETMPGSASAPSTYTQNTDATGDNRLTLTIATAELGEVSLVIDRAQAGVRVVLGVKNPAAQGTLEPEKAALGRALRAVGLDVHSVNVVRQSAVGTVLAQPTTRTRISTGEQASPSQDSAQAPRKKRKRVNLVG